MDRIKDHLLLEEEFVINQLVSLVRALMSLLDPKRYALPSQGTTQAQGRKGRA